jgi:hypothetical protein
MAQLPSSPHPQQGRLRTSTLPDPPTSRGNRHIPMRSAPQVGLGGSSRVPGCTPGCALGLLVCSPGFVITPLAEMAPVVALLRPPHGPLFADRTFALRHAHLLSSSPSPRHQTEPDDRRRPSRPARCVVAGVSLLAQVSDASWWPSRRIGGATEAGGPGAPSSVRAQQAPTRIVRPSRAPRVLRGLWYTRPRRGDLVGASGHASPSPQRQPRPACTLAWRPAVTGACAGVGPRVPAGAAAATARPAGAPPRPPRGPRGS